MHHRLRNIAFGLVVSTALAASASSANTTSVADIDLDTDLMHAIEDTNKNLASDIALKDVKAATSDSNDLNDMFEKVEAYFVQKGGADDAVELSRKNKNLTQDIVKAISVNNFTAATDSATALSRNCRTCHTFYKKD